MALPPSSCWLSPPELSSSDVILQVTWGDLSYCTEDDFWRRRAKLQLLSVFFSSFFHNAGCVFDQLFKKNGENKSLNNRCVRGSPKVQNEDAIVETAQLFWIPDQVPAQKFKQQEDFGKFYDSVIAYTDKWFDFSQVNITRKLKPNEEPSFTDLEHVMAALKLTETVNMDQLRASQEEARKARQDTTKSTDEKRAAVFQKVGKVNLIGMFTVCQAQMPVWRGFALWWPLNGQTQETDAAWSWSKMNFKYL